MKPFRRMTEEEKDAVVARMGREADLLFKLAISVGIAAAIVFGAALVYG